MNSDNRFYRTKEDAAEIERLKSEVKTVHAHLRHYRELVDDLRAEIELAAAFLDAIADIFERDDWPDKAADCRAMAAKLRG
jgi:hypothetical protein